MAGSSRSLLMISNLFLELLSNMEEHAPSPCYFLRQRSPNKRPNDGANSADRESQSNQCWSLFQWRNSSQYVKTTIYQSCSSHSGDCASDNKHSRAIRRGTNERPQLEDTEESQECVLRMEDLSIAQGARNTYGTFKDNKLYIFPVSGWTAQFAYHTSAKPSLCYRISPSGMVKSYHEVRTPVPADVFNGMEISRNSGCRLSSWLRYTSASYKTGVWTNEASCYRETIYLYAIEMTYYNANVICIRPISTKSHCVKHHSCLCMHPIHPRRIISSKLNKSRYVGYFNERINLQ